MVENASNGNGWLRASVVLQIIGVVTVFVGGFWIAAIMPIQQTMDRIGKETLALREHIEFKADVERRLEYLERKMDAASLDSKPARRP